jgi:hypothetical protein
MIIHGSVTSAPHPNRVSVPAASKLRNTSPTHSSCANGIQPGMAF